MSKFTKPLIVSPLPDGKMWKLIEPFSYYVGKKCDALYGITIEVPAGFLTDFASIPRIFWSILGHPMGRYAAAAVLHDYLYFKGLYSRKRCDQIFKEAMAVLNVPKLKRKLIYRFVRLLGKCAWNWHRRNSAK